MVVCFGWMVGWINKIPVIQLFAREDHAYVAYFTRIPQIIHIHTYALNPVVTR